MSDRTPGNSRTNYQTGPLGLPKVGLICVDDSRATLEVIRRAMARRGVAIETFDSRTALLPRLERPVLGALLDVDLGAGVTGDEVARLILAKHPSARIAFFTAGSSPKLMASIAGIGPVFPKHGGLDAAADWLDQLVDPNAAATG